MKTAKVQVTKAPPSTSLPALAPGAALRWDIVQRKFPENPGNILEIGCGAGGFAARLARRFNNFRAIEPDATSFAKALPHLIGHGRIENIALEELPEEETFDTICAFEVLEHIEDDRAALESWIKHLRKGGNLVLSVPAHANKLGAWDELVGHYRRYDPSQICALLQSLGMTQCETEIFGYPAGPLLEKARNAIAARRLNRAKTSDSFAERTRSSGRQLQPNNSVSKTIMPLVNSPLVWLQRFFPNRGIAMVVTAKRP